jgi:hypothetical protein
MRVISKLVAATAVTALLAGSASAERQFGDVEAGRSSEMFDVLVMRPVGLIGLGFGAMLWLPAAAITAAVQPTEIKKPTEALVMKPFRYVFQDPIGSH